MSANFDQQLENPIEKCCICLLKNANLDSFRFLQANSLAGRSSKIVRTPVYFAVSGISTAMLNNDPQEYIFFIRF